MRSAVAETGADRRELAREAGMGPVSLLGVAAGALVAYGAFAVLIAIATAVATAISDDVDLPNLNWEQLGIVASIIVAGVLLVSYFFGGYVAGRMARRSGAINGLLVLVLSLLLAAIVTVLVNLIVDNEDAIVANLRNIGIPTSSDEWGDVFTVAGVASLAAMAIGAVLGGLLGERWHGKLVRRALDPGVGPQARYTDRQAPAEQRQWPPPPRYEPTRVDQQPAGPPPVADRPWGDRWSGAGPAPDHTTQTDAGAPPPPPEERPPAAEAPRRARGPRKAPPGPPRG